MHCGLPHPDLLLAVLTARQATELEIYSRVEPIGGMASVSEPPPHVPQDEREARQMFDRLRRMMGG